LSKGKPDLVVAFPGGRGTADMVRKAQTAGVPVHFAYADTHDSSDDGRKEGT
jgi:formate dehydrogenase assembly factor FdhD